MLVQIGGEGGGGTFVVSNCNHTQPSLYTLDVLRNILGRYRGLCSIFGIFGRGSSQLLLHDAQSAGQLGAVGAVVAQEEGGLAVLDDVLCDIHGGGRGARSLTAVWGSMHGRGVDTEND